MRDYPRPWAICGGWALDLFLGRVTREHKDVDISVLRRDQLEVQTYLLERGWGLEKTHAGEFTPWAPGEVTELPIHTIWCKNSAFTPDFLEVLLEESSEDSFVFRRDSSVSCPLRQAYFESSGGLPLLAPELVLLFKANNLSHEGNAADFQNTHPYLGPERAAWLTAALTKLYPGHTWLQSLRQQFT